MKTRRFDYKKHLGLILVAVGVLIWLVPFIIVAIDNAVGVTGPGDSLISNFGLLIMTLGPVLVISGILVSILSYARRSLKP